MKPEPRKLPYTDPNGKVRIFPQEKWGFIDTSGAVVVNAQFDAVGDFSEGLAAVAFDTDKTRHDCIGCNLDEHWGFIDKTGKTVVQPQYSAVSSFSEGLAAVRNEAGEWGYVDTKGQPVIPFTFQTAGQFSDGLAPAGVNQKIGYIDRTGNFVIPPQFYIAGSFSEGLAAVSQAAVRSVRSDVIIAGQTGKTWAFIGKDGKNKIALPAEAKHASDFVDGLAAIDFGKSCGYVGKSGALVIRTAYSYCGDFSEGLADVYGNGKWRFIDKNGHVVLDVPYDQVRPFKDGLASFDEGTSGPNQKFGYIDKHGKQIWKPQPSL